MFKHLPLQSAWLISASILVLCMAIRGSVSAQLPAARVTDTDNQGNAITTGIPTVLIGSFPAATQGSSVTPTPNCPAGSVSSGSSTVLIGGLPAARTTDTVAIFVLMPIGTPPVPTCIPVTTNLATGIPTVLIGP